MTWITSNMCMEIREIIQNIDLMVEELQPTPKKKDPPQPPRPESPFVYPRNLPIPPRGPQRIKSSVHITTVTHHLSHVAYSLMTLLEVMHGRGGYPPMISDDIASSIHVRGWHRQRCRCVSGDEEIASTITVMETNPSTTS